ncbi:MAG: hypothetical protein Q4G02_03315 [bacterium]|nr:hypothetical protein [bacterium]
MTDISQLKKEVQPTFDAQDVNELNLTEDLTPKAENVDLAAKNRLENTFFAAQHAADEEKKAYYRQELQRLSATYQTSTEKTVSQAFSGTTQMEVQVLENELSTIEANAGNSARALFLRKQLERARAEMPASQGGHAHAGLPETIRNFFNNLNGDGSRSGNAGE